MEYTVKELIEKLQEMNGNAKVTIKTWSSDFKIDLEITENNGTVVIKEG